MFYALTHQLPKGEYIIQWGKQLLIPYYAGIKPPTDGALGAGWARTGSALPLIVVVAQLTR